MTSKPYFSIIIPTLNEAKFLPHLLQDLVSQTNQDFEVIITDAKSTDATLTIAQSFSAQLPYLTSLTSSKKNVSHQRNLGAKVARGQILVFVDADTRLPNFFLDGIKYKLSKKPADIFTTWIKPDSTHAQDIALTTIINVALEAGRLLDIPSGFGAMMGFSALAFRRLKGFNETITYAEDQEIIRRAIEHKYKFIIYPDPYFIYSLRRFRSQGTLNSLRQFAKLQTKVLTNGYSVATTKDYPMGGHHFNHHSKTPWWKKILP